ncbi:MAG: hypothetical protein GY777_28400 [Candidatus Brocadiaceae bacterium]|nr:hypothetical protein [Candidatus Brocadiaceae bacterium]
MKTPILVIACLLVLTGCITYLPVSSMTDSQLENEHIRLNVKQSNLKRALRYGRPNNRSIMIKGTVANKRSQLTMKKVKNRMLDVENEILKRLKVDE